MANVSHELRTPLTSIQGYLETLLDGALEEPSTRGGSSRSSFRHTERLGRLINDLTELSNIELGRVTWRGAALARRGRRLGRGHHRAAGGRAGRRALRRGAAGSAPSHADRDRLVQILINLVDNAVKYTSAGG